MTRRDESKWAISDAHDYIPNECSLKQRMEAIDAAYPFGDRSNHPYNIWLDERRKYLMQYGYKPKNHEPQPTVIELEEMWNKKLGEK